MKLEQDYRIVFLKRFNKRDVNAFAEIYTAFFTELHVYALRFYLNRPEMAEDAVQDAFCYLWEREDITFDCLDKIKAFLYVAIKNRFKNHLSRIDVEQKYRETLERVSVDEDILDSELMVSLWECVERIPNPEGKVLKLYLSGYEPEDIARQMKLSLQTIYNMKSKAVGKLKRFFATISQQIKNG